MTLSFLFNPLRHPSFSVVCGYHPFLILLAFLLLSHQYDIFSSSLFFPLWFSVSCLLSLSLILDPFFFQSFPFSLCLLHSSSVIIYVFVFWCSSHDCCVHVVSCLFSLHPLQSFFSSKRILHDKQKTSLSGASSLPLDV